MFKKNIEYALMLLAIQDLNDLFDSFNDNELDNDNDLIKEILLALSSSLQVLQNDTVFQNKKNKSQAPVEFQLVIFLRRLDSKDDILSICSRFRICKDTSKNNNQATVHAGFQAIRGVSECYWSNRWDSFYFK
ncbi:hypothetical protein RCL_jg27681.t1 [Rhizophagus clarus]|uniref:Uncharacterized protein n=1 Tax=Rhizophagus clarus TaxID=94130 RepID=A0A8H3KSW5_9GLOM|nr:hypothetical protein RCL_jg27681.t1 [Rhizophagus clarus]